MGSKVFGINVKVAFYSDIHGNLEALEAVLNDMKAQEVVQRLCLGDIVGYGPDPVRCLELVQTNTSHVLKGNHDEESAKDSPVEQYRPHVQAGILLARQALSPDQKQYLLNLPLKAQWEEMSLVHASIYEPEKWHYLNNPLNIEINFQNQKALVCLCGHTHVPRFFQRIDLFTQSLPLNGDLSIQLGKKYLVNVGSVGQSRDGNWHACYALYDTVNKKFEFRRIPYDIETTKHKIVEAGLPQYLADRLARGR